MLTMNYVSIGNWYNSNHTAQRKMNLNQPRHPKKIKSQLPQVNIPARLHLPMTMTASPNQAMRTTMIRTNRMNRMPTRLKPMLKFVKRKRGLASWLVFEILIHSCSINKSQNPFFSFGVPPICPETSTCSWTKTNRWQLTCGGHLCIRPCRYR